MLNLRNGSKEGFEPGLTLWRDGILALSYRAPPSYVDLLLGFNLISVGGPLTKAFHFCYTTSRGQIGSNRIESALFGCRQSRADWELLKYVYVKQKWLFSWGVFVKLKGMWSCS